MLSGGEENLLFRINSDLNPRQRSVSMNNQTSIFDGFYHIGSALQPSLGDDEYPMDHENDLIKEIDEEEDKDADYYDRDPYAEI